MRAKLLFLLFIFTSIISAQIPEGYYDSAEGLEGAELKTELYNIIHDHTTLDYSDLWDAYYSTDRDVYFESDSTLLDMYSENPVGTDPYEYTLGSDQCGDYSEEGSCYNREHSFPKSWFNDSSPMYSDLFQVYPTDGYVNGKRSNFPYGEVDVPDWISENGSKLGPNSYPGYTGTVFEPIDEFKGDLARTYFYMATCYENEIASWETNEEHGDAVLDGTSYPCYEDWFLQMLLDWHHQDPVSQREIDRNNEVYDIQGNRNPFIDHPEWVDDIWNPSPDTEAPSIPQNLAVTATTENSISVSWDASTDNEGVSSYIIYVNGNPVGNTTETNYTITNLQSSTTYSICIVAQDDAGNVSECSSTIEAETNYDPYVINENFDICPSDTFTAISEASDKDWTCIDQYGEDDSPAIQINGYQEDVSSQDWLITSQPIDFDNYTNETFSAYFAYTYGNTPLEVVYSTDYDGGNNPSAFTWTPLPNVTMQIPNNNTSPIEYTITDADISSITGTVYIAFKYFTEGYDPTRWNVDSIKIYAETASNIIEKDHADNVLIYPNPSSDGVFNLNFKQTFTNVKITIFDLSGKEIKQINRKNINKIQIKGLTQGFYIINIETPSQGLIKKIIVK